MADRERLVSLSGRSVLHRLDRAGSGQRGAERIDEQWDDPAGLGGDVNTIMSRSQKLAAAAALRDAQIIAERAVDLEDDGQERAAYDEWKKLFGNRMTRP